jgi:hypothetical protein
VAEAAYQDREIPGVQEFGKDMVKLVAEAEAVQAEPVIKAMVIKAATAELVLHILDYKLLEAVAADMESKAAAAQGQVALLYLGVATAMEAME